ncbi:uncharacterized protein LOC125633025 [Caretta caretta]|uniref:uncharacterized protein LOC125633025 n=1 Tax=Caretta caretta TaxID=8467 RepID=UPI003F4C71E3
MAPRPPSGHMPEPGPAVQRPAPRQGPRAPLAAASPRSAPAAGAARLRPSLPPGAAGSWRTLGLPSRPSLAFVSRQHREAAAPPRVPGVRAARPARRLGEAIAAGPPALPSGLPTRLFRPQQPGLGYKWLRLQFKLQSQAWPGLEPAGSSRAVPERGRLERQERAEPSRWKSLARPLDPGLRGARPAADGAAACRVGRGVRPRRFSGWRSELGAAGAGGSRKSRKVDFPLATYEPQGARGRAPVLPSPGGPTGEPVATPSQRGLRSRLLPALWRGRFLAYPAGLGCGARRA